MPLVSTKELAAMQSNTQNIRNICVLAHVDHGKTTLSDFLISSNGVISNKLAGKVRYLDSREDEQEKGITMKSSCISLIHNQPKTNNKYLVNLIDSPGHVDFSSEVSTALRLCDGALVLVDVLEGVCIQTHAVLHQAYMEKVRPCLVLNKVDRLITELQLTPAEAFRQISNILEQVNVIMITYRNADLLQQQDQQAEKATNETDEFIEDVDIDSESFFSPAKGNVVFGSAFDGWGFRVNHFAELFAQKLGVRQELLQQTLWGEHYLNVKTKRIMKKAPSADAQPMFVKFILNNIWEVYNAVMVNKDMERIEKIIKSLNINVPAKELKVGDPQQSRLLLQSIMSKWLPLSTAVLDMVAEHLPSPIEAQQYRIVRMIPELGGTNENETTEVSNELDEVHKHALEMKSFRQKLKRDLLSCNKDGELMVFVSKMIEVDTLPGVSTIRQPGVRSVPARNGEAAAEATTTSNNTETTAHTAPETNVAEQMDSKIEAIEDESIKEKMKNVSKISEKSNQYFVGFARIYSGTIRVGQEIQILGPRYNPAKPNEYRAVTTVKQLFILMGRGLEPVDEVPAGNVFGISGVSEFILKSATITSSPMAPIFSAMYFQAAPIVRIAVETKNLADMPALVEGLKLLNQSDPSVEVLVQETGEHVIMTAGEVHAERCLRDLNEKFAKVELVVSPPIVGFRETIVEIEGVKPKLVTAQTANRVCTIKMKAWPLPKNFITFVDENQNRIKAIFLSASEQKQQREDAEMELEESAGARYLAKELCEELENELKFSGEPWAVDAWRKVWALGPRRTGPNVLLNNIKKYVDSAQFINLEKRVMATTSEGKSTDEQQQQQNEDGPGASADEYIESLKDLDSSIIAGFQLATAAGPLCEEPMMGVCFSIEDITFDKSLEYEPGADPYGPFSGQVMGAVKDACRQAFMSGAKRLMEAMYTCDVQATGDVLGKVYGVLAKRRARILQEKMNEGTPIFTITALLPVVESFGFATELRTKTSGAASAMLLFSHWEILEVDPFFVPKTKEELEEMGEHGDAAPNIAKLYIDEMRRRKGLLVEDKLAQIKADKQRTISKNK